MKVEKIKISAHVRYFEDARINGVEDTNGTLMPCMNGDLWEPIIDYHSGVVTNWEKGKFAKVHYKVCDAGIYQFYDFDDNLLTTINGYVPTWLGVDDDGYGDYIIMRINEDGKIIRFNGNPQFSVGDQVEYISSKKIGVVTDITQKKIIEDSIKFWTWRYHIKFDDNNPNSRMAAGNQFILYEDNIRLSKGEMRDRKIGKFLDDNT